MSRPNRNERNCFVAALLVSTALLAWLFTVLYQSASEPLEEHGQKLLAVASFYPIYIAARNVAGDCRGIQIRNLSEPQTGCLHDFQLTPEDMKLLSTADVFLVNGKGMESFLEDTAGWYPGLWVVQTAEGLAVSEENAHVWMSIPAYRSQVDAIAEALCKAAPAYREEIQSNAAEYDRKLAELEKQQEEIKKSAEGRIIISLHDAYEYLAKDYGLQTAYRLNLDEERQISAGEAAALIDAVRQNKMADQNIIVFAEELYGKEIAEMIKKETGADVYYPDTLVRGDGSLDSYIDGMQKNIDILEDIFGE